VARVVADRMSRTLGQQVVVENLPGAGGAIATRQIARSEPDGYTLGLGNTATLAIAPTVLPNVGYDPRMDFAPVGLIATSSLILIVHPSVPVRSVQGLITLALSQPGKLNYASGGAGSPTHLAPELFASMAGIKINHVPYKGTAPAITDLLGGHVTMAFSSLPSAIGAVRDRKVRALAVTGAKSSTSFPNVPTIAESGLPGYEASQRYGIIAPARTPRVIIDKLNTVLREALASAEVNARIEAEGAVPLPGTPEDYAVDIDREEGKWSKVIKEAGIQL
jgi:tripartite-type tricarboxylate transporter receptor subunit TctC